ncbi:MAG: glycosyltransferase family 2 protein [Clostridia bacterium]|nr:glycosyltransferase family 2 protein [Clostridia bacterium]
MKFSILVPVYNVEKYLEQCVESLLNQTFKGEYEIILVDDGSTDSSCKICDEYQKNNPDKIKVVHKKNEGLVSARQVGIENAKGEYSLFVDSDDYVENNLLETVNECINRNDNTDMVIYSFRYYSSGKTTERKTTLTTNETVFTKDNKKELYEALISTTFITSLWTKALKTEILKNDPTDYSLYYDKNMAEDWFRSIHLLTDAKKIVYINEPLYNYRTNEESISRSFRPETIEKKNILYVYDRFMEYLPKWDMDTEEYRQKLNARWLNETIYTFSIYYENVEKSERNAVLNYDWNSMLPEGVKNGISNPHENKTSRKLYALIAEKKFLNLKLHFAYKNIYKNYRKLKSRLLNK